MRLITIHAVAAATGVLLFSQTGFATPACLYADSDSDNDGWGWENNSSCQVTSSTPAAASANPVVAPQSSPSGLSNQSGHPVCTTTLADPDGDGYGWEFNQSCIVVIAGQSNTSAPIIEAAVAGPEPVTETEVEVETVESATQPASPVNAPVIEVTSPTNNTADDEIINGLYRGRHQICSSVSADSDGDGWGYEFNHSCKVVEGYIVEQAEAITPPSGNAESEKVGQIYSQSFDNAGQGLYQADQLNDDWETPLWHLGFDQGRVRIVDTGENHGNAMEVTYPAGRYGAGGTSAFLSDIQFGMGLPKPYEELYVSYDIRFADGFDFVKGGKLPGLCGSNSTQLASLGCNTGGGIPTGYDGWSARGMWREDGALENYIYHAGQRNYFADDELWDVSATPGVWHNVQHRVVLNTTGQKNGILEAWFDGTKVLSITNLEYRKVDDVGINLFYFSTFFGGNDSSWAPSTDQTMNFDNFIISTDKIN